MRSWSSLAILVVFCDAYSKVESFKSQKGLHMNYEFYEYSFEHSQKSIIYVVPHDQSHPETKIKPGTCEVVAIRRYLKLRCVDEKNSTYFKCTHEDGTYKVRQLEFGGLMFDRICEDDPGFYQICGHQKSLAAQDGDDEMLCGDFICDQKTPPRPAVDPNDWKIVTNYRRLCNGRINCTNVKVAKEDCKQRVRTDLDFDCREYDGRYITVPYVWVCDSYCDCPNCADEVMTKSDFPKCTRTYPLGMYCNKTFSSKKREVFIEPYMICDSIKHCDEGEDERDCTSDEFCENSYTTLAGKIQRSIRPLQPRQKCSRPTDYFDFNDDGNYSRRMCSDLSDQFNCPDESMNQLECYVGQKNGLKLTKLSQYILDCNIRKIIVRKIFESQNQWDLPYDNITGRLSFCNDSIDDSCVDVGGFHCVIQKHRMCDDNIDCPITMEDETNDICKDMEDVTCVRRIGGLEKKIPSKWVGDGVRDCVDGLDENTEFWRNLRENFTHCGDKNDWSSIKSKNCAKEKFYFCSNITKEMISYDMLCDRIPSCGNEEMICRVSRNHDKFWTKLSSSSAKPHMREFGYCLPGLRDLASLKASCVEVEEDPVFGVQLERVKLPNQTFDCRYLFGEPYLAASCHGMCVDVNTTCKLTALLKDSCEEDVPREERLYSVALSKDRQPYLTLVTQARSYYSTLQLFQCKSGKCITYDRVCDLANDCGDWSDEQGCTNQFSCKDNGERISLNRYCDAVFDCSDYSDECGGECNRSHKIIELLFLEICSWTIGSLATILNTGSVTTTLLQLYRQSSTVKVINLCFVALIGLGDMCVGMYLIAISIINHQYTHGDKTFCKDYYRWLTSDTCSALGVLNTFGSQLSLYSMTLLSVFRVFCIKNSNLKGNMSPKSRAFTIILCSCLILTAASTSFIPLLPTLEDYFVNGLAYFNNPIFIGSHDKDRHLAVLREHYGNFQTEELSWKQIRKMVADMFSRFNNEPVVGQKVNFYGNSGVCLFKFFVRENDPQKRYTWFIIIKNAICFFVISLSYLIIHLKVEKSTRKLTEKNKKKLSKTPSQRKQSKKTGALNRKITLMVLTDFLCWVPFIVVCSLHYFEVLDATKMYSLFSIVILPLNSVINPLLYDNSGILDAAKEKLLKFRNKVGNSKNSLKNKRMISETELSKIKSDHDVDGQKKNVKDTTMEQENTTPDDEDPDVITIHPATAL